jgi:hypothetical protein
MVSNILVAHVFIGIWMLYLLVSRRWAGRGGYRRG